MKAGHVLPLGYWFFFYPAINCKCNARTLCHRATVRFGNVRSQFLISKIVTVFAYMNFVVNKYNLLPTASVVKNMKNTEKSLIFYRFQWILSL